MYLEKDIKIKYKMLRPKKHYNNYKSTPQKREEERIFEDQSKQPSSHPSECQCYKDKECLTFKRKLVKKLYYNRKK